MWRRWMPSPIWWRTISAASTSSNTRPPIRPWTEPSAPSISPPRLRAIQPCARAAATTPRRTRRPTSDDSHPVASLARLPPPPVAEALPALAHRDLLGSPRRRDHLRPVLELRLAAAARTPPLSPLGGADELGAGTGRMGLAPTEVVEGIGHSEERLFPL